MVVISVKKMFIYIFFIFFNEDIKSHKSAKVPGYHNFGPSFDYDRIPGLGLDR